jgi:hypothetical protein
MKEVYIILLSLLVIIWWVGVWGCIECCISMVAKNNQLHSFYMYFGMSMFVILLFLLYPHAYKKVLEI